MFNTLFECTGKKKKKKFLKEGNSEAHPGDKTGLQVWSFANNQYNQAMVFLFTVIITCIYRY